MKRGFHCQGIIKQEKVLISIYYLPFVVVFVWKFFFYLLQDLQQKCKKTGKNSWDPRGLSSLPYKVPVRYEHTYKAGLRIYIILYG